MFSRRLAREGDWVEDVDVIGADCGEQDKVDQEEHQIQSGLAVNGFKTTFGKIPGNFDANKG